MRPESTLDIECYRNYFLVMFKEVVSLRKTVFVQIPGQHLDIIAIIEYMRAHTDVTFNGIGYDLPMLLLALTDVSNEVLKEASDSIIKGLKWWDFLRYYRLDMPEWLDHVDIMEVAPGVRVSLKMYAGRMHARKMQDLPFDPAELIKPSSAVRLMLYCDNDHDNTRMLLEAVRPRLELRQALTEQYGVDVRSKSDAQIAEAVIKARLSFTPERRYIQDGYSFQYTPPACIGFQTPELQAAFDMIKRAWFVVRDEDQISDPDELFGPDGKKIKTGVKIPPEIKGLVINIGTSKYKIGIGGLHSQEEAAHHYTTARHVITDHDVTGYYPSLIIGLGMYPEQLGPEFLTIYREIYDKRVISKSDAERLITALEAEAARLNLKADALDASDPQYAQLRKQAKDLKTIADGLKIVLNGTFGKLFSKYSILFAPELGIRVTLTGQLYLLMLIEYLELNGISVVSANTDGIVLKTPVELVALRDSILATWEKLTGLNLEATAYDAIFSANVNNYIAFKPGGKHKGKGWFGESGVIENKHPDCDILKDAVIAYLRDGTPLERTVSECRDIRKFITVRNVKGGGSYVPEGAQMHYELVTNDKGKSSQKLVGIDGLEYLGKAVRWYYGTSKGYIVSSSLHKVASSDSAVPMMLLSDNMPCDVDYARYNAEAHKLLATLGLRVHYL